MRFNDEPNPHLQELLERLPSIGLSRRHLVALMAAGLGRALAAPLGGASAEASSSTPLFRATELNHVALRVTDLERSEAFYRNVLGLETLRVLDSVRFMGCGPHFVALFRARSPGLDHLAFSWPGYEQAEAVRRLEGAGLTPEVEENRTYFDDPDGNQLQLAWNEDWPGSGPRPDPREG